MRSLAAKLTLAFLVVGVMGAVSVALFVGRSTQREFDQFVIDRYRADVVAELAAYYQKNGSWSGIEAILVRDPNRRPGRWRPGWVPVTLVDANRIVVYGGWRYRVGEHVSRLDSGQSVPIEVDGETVGWLLFDALAARAHPPPGSPEWDFLVRVTRATVYSALGATVLALLLGILLARTISRPVRELTAATHRVAQGDLGHQVPVRTKDELGELAASFNQMSADLARSNQLRRQMTADIAHELRTPLSVILGYTEALSDGKLHPTPETFEIMHEEAKHLGRLIEDLQTLALADAGELSLTRRATNPRALLERAAAAYGAQAQQKGITLQVKSAPDLPQIEVDPDRMAQVLSNLVSNALRYTPAGGEITLSATFRPPAVVLQVSDTGAGIAPEDLPHVFERFYRGDKARQRQEGESGLGLAIAKSIVEIHGGTITVDSRPGEGTTFTIELPAHPGLADSET